MPGVATLGDLVYSPHGIGDNCKDPAVYSAAEASLDVFVNTRGVVRADGLDRPGDAMEEHPFVGCEVGTSTLDVGSLNVFVNGLGMGGLGDAYGYVHFLTTASIDVFVNGPDPVE